MIKRFLRDSGGSVAMMTGTTFLLLTMAAGGAYDYSNATSQRQSLQEAVDASALHAIGIFNATEAEREAAFGHMLATSETCARITCGTPTVSFFNGTMTARVPAEVPTALLQVFAVNSISIDAEASANATGGPLKVVMVLDYSSSMNNSNKYQNMRTAAVAFMDNALAHPQGNVAVGVTPFSQYVLTAINGSHVVDVEGGTNLDGVDIVGCVSNRGYPHAVSSATPDPSIPASKWRAMSFTMGSDPSVGGYSDLPSSESSSHDCGDYADENLAVRPLSKTLASTKAAIQAMKPTGGTNIALGLDVGWHMLTDNEPFTEATIDDPEANRVMILLTDGDQTIPAEGPSGNSVADANSNIAEICNGIKADDIEVFVIAFAVTSTSTQTLLKNCATGDPFYYHPDVSDDLDLIFQGIYNTITNGEARLAS